jgi:hypothetical protein
MVGVNFAIHAVTAFWAAAKTSRGRRTPYVLRTLDSGVTGFEPATYTSAQQNLREFIDLAICKAYASIITAEDTR